MTLMTDSTAPRSDTRARINGFTIDPSNVHRIGEGLARPESVLATADGDIYTSDLAGIRRIRPDGTTTLYAGLTKDGEVLGANGFALMPDGSFLVCALFGGGVYRLDREGRATPFLLEVDGRSLDCPNFIMVDDQDRIWIASLTAQDRREITGFQRDRVDGSIILVDQDGARTVARGIGYPNEIRIDASGRWLYTNETMLGRLLRFPLLEDSSLGEPEVVVEFDESNMLDGFTLDADGGAWLTALVSNRIWHIDSGGEVRLITEQYKPAQLARLIDMQRHDGVSRAILYEECGGALRNVSSLSFGGPNLTTLYLGSLCGDSVAYFESPVAGIAPVHWNYGPFDR